MTVRESELAIPKTCAELYTAANLPFNGGNDLISKANKDLVVECFTKIYPNFGFGYMHSSDHLVALRILLEREPTFREVYDSYHAGSRNIDLARQKAGGGLRPEGWDSWTPEQRRHGVLVHLYGIVQGSKILDGKRADPSPEKTRDLLLLWNGISDLPSDPPTVLPPVPPPPVKPPLPPTVTPPVVPPSPPPVFPPLSSADQRAEELWTLTAPIVKLILTAFQWHQPNQKARQLWLVGKPLAVVLIEAWRRRNRVLPLIVLVLSMSLSGCNTWTAVRLCGVKALDPRKECVFSFWGNTRSGQITSAGPQLVPRGLYPSAPKPRPLREIELDEICGRQALRQQQEYFSKHGVPTPYAPLEQKCKQRERRARP